MWAKNKYGRKRIQKSGIWFDSKFESFCHDQLCLLEKAGEIEIIKCQDKVLLSDAEISWKVDFKVLDLKNKQLKWIEAKGIETSDYQIKKKLWKVYGPGPLEIWKGKVGNFRIHETILPLTN